ncbi:hypothetical protein Tco_0876216 [Tanacetum coccineum]|uniref:Uncharacterized protein n=1 Tax=Tanacetum coccineum TaxID=301880 RepID=A0ABQ5BRT5_9ASTR
MLIQHQSEVGDNLDRAATTASSLEAEHVSRNITKTRSKATLNEPTPQGTGLGSGHRRQDTKGDTITRTRFKNVSKTSYDSPLGGVNTPRSNEDSMQLKELIVDHPAPAVIAPIAEVVAPEPAASTGSPSSTTVDQDAPSPSNSQTTPKTQSPVISNDVEEENHYLDVAHMNNDPFFGIPIPENDSKASSSSDVIPIILHTAAPNSEYVTKWTKDHPLDNIIGELERPVSTRLDKAQIIHVSICVINAFMYIYWLNIGTFGIE